MRRATREFASRTKSGHVTTASLSITTDEPVDDAMVIEAMDGFQTLFNKVMSMSGCTIIHSRDVSRRHQFEPSAN